MSASFEFEVDTRPIDELLAKHPQRKNQFMDAMAEASVSEMKDSFNTSPPGLAYDRGNGRVHIASQPGYPPNTDYGDLINSLRWERAGSDVREIHGAEHGKWLEDSAELDRPFIDPAFREIEGDILPLGQQWLRIGE